MRILLKTALPLAGLCVFMCILSSIAYTQVTSSSQLLSGFNQFADTSLKNVPASAYPDYAKTISEYLTGGRTDLNVTAADGTERPGFTEKELAHMMDVLGLVRRLSLFRYFSGGLFLLILGLYCWCFRSETPGAILRDILAGIAVGCYLLMGLILALALWGTLNFTGLFVTFHKALFNNSLWLLNPREHLLIMLMPTPFFIWYAKQILFSFWPVLVLAIAVLAGYLRLSKQSVN